MDDREYEEIRAAFDEHFVSGARFHEASARERAAAARKPLPPPRPRGRRRRPRAEPRSHRTTGVFRHVHTARYWLAFVAVVAVVALVRPPDADTEPALDWTSGAPIAARAIDVGPPPRRADSRTPLGAPQAFEDPAGRYRFMVLQPDGESPTAYDPCRPLTYVVNLRAAPPGAEAVLREAIAAVSAITGLQFVDEGPTDEPVVEAREAHQPQRYGDRWAPILIAWSDPVETPTLAGYVAGQAGSTAIVPAGERDSSKPVTSPVSVDSAPAAASPGCRERAAPPAGATEPQRATASRAARSTRSW